MRKSEFSSFTGKYNFFFNTKLQRKNEQNAKMIDFCEFLLFAN